MMESTSQYHRWIVRILLACLLFFGSEILLWIAPNKPVVDVLLSIPAYIILATIMLDIMWRYRIRDLTGLMTLAGAYGLINGLVINPNWSFVDFPLTLVIRVTGAQSLLGLEMIFLFLFLTGGHLKHLRWVTVLGSVIVGLAWGTWTRWSGQFESVNYTEAVPLSDLFVWAGVIIALILVLTFWAYRKVLKIYPADMLISLPLWIMSLIYLLLWLLLRIAQLSVNSEILLLSLTLFVLCSLILWFRKNTTYKPLMVLHLPIYPVRTIQIIVIIGFFAWSTILSHSLPLIGSVDWNQLSIVNWGFTLYGLVWLPAVCVILGTRAYIRQMQAGDI